MNSDLQQYNGTASFPATADVGTNADPMLIPTDGPIVTADLNGGGQAPVNVALARDKDLLLGLRGATFGDFVGALLRTMKSVSVDAIGGVLSAATPGDILASGAVRSTNMFTTAVTGIFAGGQAIIDSLVRVGLVDLVSLSGFGLGITATTNISNPPQGTHIKNQLRAINIPKVGAYIKMSAPGVIASYDGYGVASVVIDAGNLSMTVTFVDAFSNTNYRFHGGICTAGINVVLPGENPASRTTTSCKVFVADMAGLPVDFSVTAVSFSVEFNGQQTT